MALPLAGLARAAKLGIIDAQGTVTRSEIYFTNVETEEEVHLSMTPEKVQVKTEASFRNYQIVEVGEVRIPKGEHLTQISWNGILPGAGMLLYPFLSHAAWEDPQELIKVFKRWREEGAKLRLLITQTPINLEVYIRAFDYEASGGMGDYRYSIDLIAAKELQVLTVEEADAQREQQAQNSQDELNRRAALKSDAGVWIEKIDDVYAAVKILTGNGSLADVERVLDASGISSPDDFMTGEPQLLIWG